MKFRRNIAALLVGASAALAIVGAVAALRPSGNPAIIAIDDIPAFKAVYLVNNPEATRVYTHVIIQSGEADATGLEGSAHYVEHLTWLNTVGRMPADANRDTNAWTTSRATGYWLSGDIAKFADQMATVLKVFNPIEVDAEFAEEERSIIMREYDMKFAQNAAARANVELDRALYAGNGLARSVIGKPENIAAFNLKEAIAFHDATHRPENAVLVVIGNITPEAIRRAVAAVAKPQNVPIRNEAGEFKLAQSGRQVTTLPDPGKPPQLLWRKAIRLDEPVQYDLLVTRGILLGEILDSNLEGGLSGPLTYDAFIASRFSIGISAIDERHVELIFLGRPDSGISIDRLGAAFEQALSETGRKGISKQTYDRVKIRYDEARQKPTTMQAQADELAAYVLDRVSTRHAPLETDQVWSLHKQPDLESINALLAKLVGDGRTTIAIIGNQGS